MTLVTARADYGYLAKLLCALPSDVRVRLTLDYSDREHELMARDMPREGRRFTNLTTGSEWFITEESLRNVGVQAVQFEPFVINVIG